MIFPALHSFCFLTRFGWIAVVLWRPGRQSDPEQGLETNLKVSEYSQYLVDATQHPG